MPIARLPAIAGAAGLLLAVVSLTGCTRHDSNYYPLEPPRWWYYEIHETVLDEARESRYLMLNAGTAELAGETVYLQSAQAGSLDYLHYRGDGVERLASRRPGMPGPMRDDAARIILPESLDSDQPWRVRSTLGLIESRTFEPLDRLIVRRLGVELEKKISARDVELTMAAGNFDHCLQIDGEGHTFVPTDRGNAEAAVVVRTSEWYAPGIGLVKLERSESSDSPFLKSGHQVWELADFGD